MIEAHEFIDSAREGGFGCYGGVPCSFLTPFINYVIERNDLTYVSSANEGDAVALAAGAYLGGQPAIAMMQNSGLGNAVNPLTSLTHTFHIPILLIITLRGDPTLRDEPQHELMGQITGSLLEAMEIPWEYFPLESKQIHSALERAHQYMQQAERPYAFIMRKNSVAPYGASGSKILKRATHQNNELHRYYQAGSLCSRSEALADLLSRTPEKNTVVIATTGYTGRELCALEDRPNQIYMVGSMGCASSLGLGLSLARPDLRVVVIDGDGAALMRMGNLATVGTYGGPNLIHVLLDNEVHDSTGAQATVSNNFSFAQVAKACGYSLSLEGNTPSLLDELFTAPDSNGPRFAQLKIRPGAPADLPRPPLTPPEIKARLMAHLKRIP
ncbi:phosphonopyruvate decarboxylase [Nitrosococcus oceani]|uniref:Thiamine pyrophosphate enzyme n=2 Tax=Nitrosococcus oceani TaxID=1229 RepID=Q3JBI2_NITOC|nr:phosphonopyruvate decarboxylase [Nitrosococcus oceani]KFI19753.1 phosphonopyruvate decarboxylase [Nitrosococcus oceani C-27]ABA57814.1 Thiamine pyrophosphate enzyme [Nitrosococcus oceani ATCC 19707]EDZ66900.1 phosphonopyruvate decarboxylase [Nitrosococcus oceani AFC27]KFI22919.1 phosphonopyruvate decarboxylase [Nitrosococcus oceani]GEM19449.1 phosphonopyruvate decarboxylase [Nitrosococcus oceani]